MWGDGFWNLLVFGMQMVFIIVIGYVFVSFVLVKSLLCIVVFVVKMFVQGVMLVIFFGLVVCVINWGFGLVVGVMFVCEVVW